MLQTFKTQGVLNTRRHVLNQGQGEFTYKAVATHHRCAIPCAIPCAIRCAIRCAIPCAIPCAIRCAIPCAIPLKQR